MKQINIGLLGLGAVGAKVYENLQRNTDVIARRIGARLVVKRVAVRNLRKRRALSLPRGALTTNISEILNDPQIDIVVELIGTPQTARPSILEAMRRGKTVVTANKALLTEHGAEIFNAAEKHNANLFFEASVCGGIPIIKILREGLVANRFPLIYGIVNGTCNYILSQMSDGGKKFDQAVREAQALGYAEADPSTDVDGDDAGHKATILAWLAHGFWTGLENTYIEGIRRITPFDIQTAREMGYRIKQLAIIKRDEKSGTVEVRVHPTLIPQNHVLANVNDVFNGVVVRGDVVGDTMFYGQGAGGEATSSAVIADLADAALNLISGRTQRTPTFTLARDGQVRSIDDTESRYYLRLTVADRPGVIAQVSKILGDANISIASVLQPEAPEPKPGEKTSDQVPLIMMLHTARDRKVRDAVAKISKLRVVKARTVVIRVENF